MNVMIYFVPAIVLGTLMLMPCVLAIIVPPSYACVDDKLSAKYYGNNCTNDTDCSGRHTMICDNGKCACKENFVPADRFVGESAVQKVCVPAPYIHAECSTTCQKPYVCKEHARLKKNICQCVSPFKLTGDLCHLDCKENETYSSHKFQCVRTCNANEINIDENCLLLSNVNEFCNVSKQCFPAYSECRNGLCQCIQGFVTDQDGNCFPREIVCPNGHVTKSPRKCNGPSDCPSDSFCFTPDKTTITSGVVDGFCCPSVEPKCPVGKPHRTAKCNFSSSQYCPFGSHECMIPYFGADALCCPKGCEIGKLYIGGKCYPSVYINDRCVHDEQCSGMNLGCVNGVCKCVGNAIEEKHGTRSLCAIRCQSDEIKRDNQCYKPLSLGDNCANETWRCPRGSICNKFGVCSCKCPQFTLAKDVCAPLPQCPAPRRHRPNAPMSLVVEHNKHYNPISTEKRQELLKNVTFCSIPRKKGPEVDHVRKCAEGQYCANYINNLGVCCTIPEYLCPNGKKPTSVKQCSKKTALSCGLGEYCHEFLHTAHSRDPDGKMCCMVDENLT